jgi:hypothetical protein
MNIELEYDIKFSIKYLTKLGENMMIYGNIHELGNWKQSKFKLKWYEGHVWKGTLTLPTNIKCFEYKFVCEASDGSKRWEQGPDRTFMKDKMILKSEEIVRLDCTWECFYIRFSIYFPLKSDTEYMRMVGDPKELGSWLQNNGTAVKMILSKKKTIGSITGRFWEALIPFSITNSQSLDFEYRYNIYSPIKSNFNLFR